MIYIVFILLFLAIRELGWRREFSSQECLANAMSLLAESTYRELTQHEHELARKLLYRCEPDESLVVALRTMLERIEARPAQPPGRLLRTRQRVRDRYPQLAGDPRFGSFLVGVFSLVAVGTLVQVSLDAHRILTGMQHLRVITAAGMVSSVVVAGLILVGVSAVRKSRFDAYRWFDRALLVQVFFTEVFAFLERQFGAVFELLFFMCLLLTLRVMIHTEVHAAAGPGELRPAATAPEANAVVRA